MRRLIPTTLALVAIAFSAPALAADMARYVNARFSYAISYPTRLLQALPESENGDGRTFRSAQSRAEARVWGGYNALSRTPTQIAQELTANCIDRNSAYRRVRHGLVAVSCITVEGVFYQKTLIRGQRMMSFSMIYPISERRTWDPVVTRMAASMNLH